MATWYDKEQDIFNLQLKKGVYWKSVELPNGVVLDIAQDGSIIGVEILRASKVFSGDIRKVIENAPAVPAM